MPQIKKLRSLSPDGLVQMYKFSELGDKLKEELMLNEQLKADLLQEQISYQEIQLRETFVDFEFETIQPFDFIAKEKLANQINKVRIQNINIQREIEKIKKEIEKRKKEFKEAPSEEQIQSLRKYKQSTIDWYYSLTNMEKNHIIRYLWDKGIKIQVGDFYWDFLLDSKEEGEVSDEEARAYVEAYLDSIERQMEERHKGLIQFDQLDSSEPEDPLAALEKLF